MIFEKDYLESHRCCEKKKKKRRKRCATQDKTAYLWSAAFSSDPPSSAVFPPSPIWQIPVSHKQSAQVAAAQKGMCLSYLFVAFQWSPVSSSGWAFDNCRCRHLLVRNNWKKTKSNGYCLILRNTAILKSIRTLKIRPWRCPIFSVFVIHFRNHRWALSTRKGVVPPHVYPSFIIVRYLLTII